jgi:outer membrane protein insertion porin family/translocation and assembly module TamA
LFGRGGTVSANAAGGGYGTGKYSERGCRAFLGTGNDTEQPQPATQSITDASVKKERFAKVSGATRSMIRATAGAALALALGVIRVRPLPAVVSALGMLRFFSLFALLLALFSVGCTSVPPGRSAVKSVDITGNDAIDTDDLKEKIATAESPEFLAFFQGVVYDWNVFDRFVLERDLQRIERYYRSRGYYQARARAGRVFFISKNKVRVDIVVEEGPVITVGRVDLHGLEGLPLPVIADITKRVKRNLKVDKPFQEDKFEDAAKTLQSALEDNGYAYAKVARAADVDLPKGKAAVGFFVTLGPITRFGEVTITGLGKIPEDPVRRALDLHPGTPYSRSELDAAQRALLDLNVFSSVVIEPDLTKGQHEAAPEVPIKVTVEPSKLKAVHVGAGGEVDSLKAEVHAIGGWENRNFLGGLRSLTFEAKPGVVLFPTRFPGLKTPTKFLPEGRFDAGFRQPGFLEPRTGLFFRLDGSIAPLIFASTEDKGPVLGYRDIRLTGGLDRSIWRLYGALSHTVQFDSPFVYSGTCPADQASDPMSPNCLDSGLKSIVISYPELFVTLDLRDQRIHPHAGAFFSNDLQIAGAGGSATDVREQAEARGYVPLAKKWTLAARVTGGVLLPKNYGQTIEPNANHEMVDHDASVRDIQLMFLRGFFSGGAGSNRGYALREIGPHGIVPQASSTQAEACGDLTMKNPTCELPLGGFTLWEASLELRFPLSGALTGAAFTDTSDVSDKKLDFRLNRPHLSVGLGARYDTPVGPIRFDAGYRVPGLQGPSGAADEVPSTTFLYGHIPIALSFGIGEAF